MEAKAFPVVMPSGARYWTVLQADLEVMPEADAYLRYLRLGRDGAELSTETYSHGIALYLRWCERTGRDWREAAADLGLFMTWLRYVPKKFAAPDAGRDGAVLVGPGQKPARGERRINNVLTAVRGFLSHAVVNGSAPAEIMQLLYEIADTRSLPEEARGDHPGLTYRLRARHRVKEPKRPVDRATDEEIVALFRACHSCRDRLIVLLMARGGLRRGQVVGLRREDVHFLVDSRSLGCTTARSHLHVVRRDNPNGAWSKSRGGGVVPVDFLLVQAYDQYEFERASVPGADESDFVIVNLFRGRIGAPMQPGEVNDLITRLGTRAGLDREITPHQLRHAFGGNIVDAGGTVDELQELMLHASIRSTAPYVHPDAGRLRAAVDRVPSPRDLLREA